MPAGALSPIHWMVVALVALLVLGPEKAAGAMRSLGRGWAQFQALSQRPLEHLLDLAEREEAAEPDVEVGSHQEEQP